MWPERIDFSGVLLLAVAPFVGSFIGVVIRRLPRGGAIAWDRSRCPYCATPLAPRDLVPFFSWACRRGACRHCGHRLGWFYPAIEGASLLLAVLSLAATHDLVAWVAWGLGCWLLTLGWIDAECWALPDALTLPLIPLGLLSGAALSAGSMPDRLAGAIVGYVALRLLGLVYHRLRGRDGLGGGDAKMLAASGAWVGASGLPSVVLAAAVAALIAAGLLRLRGMALHAQTALPFGPFLALATWLVWLLGPITH